MKHMSSGYTMTYVKGKNGNIGEYRYTHALLMERKLGRRLLPDEEVNHKNSIKDDNRLENLELVVRGQPRDGLKSHSAVDGHLRRGGRPAGS